MDLTTSLRRLGGSDDDASLRLAAELGSVEIEIAALLKRFRDQLDEDDEHEFGDGEAAALFRLIEEMRVAADEHERSLLRHLKWGGEGMTWEQVAEAVDGQLGGRQAMQKRWARLTDGKRRTTTGDMRRGAAARRSAVADVDTTTAAEVES